MFKTTVDNFSRASYPTGALDPCSQVLVESGLFIDLCFFVRAVFGYFSFFFFILLCLFIIHVQSLSLETIFSNLGFLDYFLIFLENGKCLNSSFTFYYMLGFISFHTKSVLIRKMFIAISKVLVNQFSKKTLLYEF